MPAHLTACTDPPKPLLGERGPGDGTTLLKPFGRVNDALAAAMPGRALPGPSLHRLPSATFPHPVRPKLSLLKEANVLSCSLVLFFWPLVSLSVCLEEGTSRFKLRTYEQVSSSHIPLPLLSSYLVVTTIRIHDRVLSALRFSATLKNK